MEFLKNSLVKENTEGQLGDKKRTIFIISIARAEGERKRGKRGRKSRPPAPQLQGAADGCDIDIKHETKKSGSKSTET